LQAAAQEIRDPLFIFDYQDSHFLQLNAGGRRGGERAKLKAMQTPSVFVVAPLDPEGQQVKDVVRLALEENGFTAVPYDDAIPPGALRAASVFDAIRAANLVVGDVGRLDPNVLYELGFAGALRKPTIVLFSLKSGASLPSDLVGFHCTLYDPTNLGALADAIKADTRAFLLRRSA
jgi:hypothetical protein